MLVCVAGPLCAGKKSVASILVQSHGFKEIRLATEDDDDGAIEQDVLQMESVDALMSFLMTAGQWQSRWVVEVRSLSAIAVLRKRPFVLVVAVDAPAGVRWDRFRQKHARADLDAFFRLDARLYLMSHDASDTAQPKIVIGRTADFFLSNAASLDDLQDAVASLAFLSPSSHQSLANLRPDWDTYFMLLADLAAHRSNCMKRRVGCLVVRDNRVLATGYNGTPRGLPNCAEGGCQRCNDGASCGSDLMACICMHAEENALLEIGRERISGRVVLYCNTCPCLGCTKKIIHVGIGEVVYRQSYGETDVASLALMNQAGVVVRQYEPTITLQLFANQRLK